MSLAPEPYLTACLSVLTSACINARLRGWSGEGSGLTARQSEEIADLMDAVHNIPYLIQRWEDCDEVRLRNFLEAFDEKWQGGLLAAYEDGLTRAGGSSKD